MRRWVKVLFLLVFALIFADQARAQRSGAGLFLGPGICNDVIGQITQQSYCLDYSTGALYTWNGSGWQQLSGNIAGPVANVTFVGNGNGSNDVTVINNAIAPNAQAGFFVQNSNGTVGGFSATSPGSTFGAPYLSNQAYINGDSGNGLLVYGGGGPLHLAASGAPFTLDVTADGNGNFNFASNNGVIGNGIITFQSNSVTRVLSENNTPVDDFQVLAQNLTQGVGIGWSYIRSIGSCANCSLDISSKPGGALLLQNSAAGSQVVAVGPVVIQYDWHLYSTNNGVTPSFGSCPNGLMDVYSTDTAGLVSFNAPGTQYCLINFARGYGVPPYCICDVVDSFSPSTIIGRCFATVNTSQVQLNFDSGVQNSTAKAVWHCIGGG